MRYLLIHGSWHGGWAWSKLTPFLKAENHNVWAPDLPGSGEDAEGAKEMSYRQIYRHIIELIHSSSDLIIVAHSSAGMFVAQAAEECHHLIRHIFYIAAWLPKEGLSLIDRAIFYDNSEFHRCFADSKDTRLSALNPEKAKYFLYHDCDIQDQDWAAGRLRPKAAQPDLEKMPSFTPHHTLEKSTYVVCEKDKAINPVSQRDMAQQFGFLSKQIKSINSGHSPFLSRPQELAHMLLI